MGTSEKVNEESCYVTLIYNKLVSLDKDIKWLYQQGTKDSSCEAVINSSLKYFQNEKRFWLKELKKYLDKLEY